MKKAATMVKYTIATTIALTISFFAIVLITAWI